MVVMGGTGSGDEYTDEEAERRATEAIRRALKTPHKPLRDFVGKSDRAQAMARARKRKPAKVPKSV